MADQPRVKPTRVRALAAAVAACAALAALPAASHADVLSLGSDLKKPADTVEAHGADSAFWAPTIDGAAGAVPVSGQVTSVRVKGIVLADPRGRAHPDPMFHVQILHPIGGGAVRVSLSSGAFRLPVGGDPQGIHSFAPIRLCASKGDYVDFNDIGGFEWRWGTWAGMPFQIFSRTPLSSTNFFSKNAGTNNGQSFTPALLQGQELLMQYQLSTGPDAVSRCGGFKEHAFKGLEVPHQTKSAGGGSVRMRAKCPFRTFGSCRGVLVLKAVVSGKVVTLGGAAFSIPQSWTKSIQVGISGQGVNLARKPGGLNATVIADAHDDPRSGGAPRGLPVQHKKTIAVIRLTG